jgi:hypothetical protein
VLVVVVLLLVVVVVVVVVAPVVRVSTSYPVVVHYTVRGTYGTEEAGRRSPCVQYAGTKTLE